MAFPKGHKFGNRFTADNQPKGKGRPKKPDLIKVLEQLLVEDIGNGKTLEQALMFRLTKLASDGDVRALGMILDRIHGKPKESIDVTTTGVPQVLILPPETDITPYLSEADVLADSEGYDEE
jgi:hypothetical protein